jgi:two-component system, NtrC family, nitrogen regulation sensor histidine kinase NtrY
MTFRRKLLTVFTLTVFLSVAAVAWLVQVMTRTAFETTENQRTAALVTQFQREFGRRSDDVARRVAAIAASEPVGRMAATFNGTVSDSAEYFDLARQMAEGSSARLFWSFWTRMERLFLRRSGRRSSAIPDSGFESLSATSGQGAFLKREELQDSTGLGTVCGEDDSGQRTSSVRGGRAAARQEFSIRAGSAGRYAGAALPEPQRSFLGRLRSLDPSVPRDGIDASRPAEKFAPLVAAVQQYNQEVTGIVSWSSDQAQDEVFHAIPLTRWRARIVHCWRILLVGNSRRSYVELKRRIRESALLVGGGGIILAILLSSWASARVTRPVEQLARAAQDVAAGKWDTQVEIRGGDELAQLAESFNRMTAELMAQKERLVQTERVAAWRELARRLAHELKNPLFPLQLTVENLMRARTQSPEQFDEVFRESSSTLLAEISNLKAIIGRFSEFSKMPHPQLQAVRVNDILRGVMKTVPGATAGAGARAITCKLELEDSLGTIAADGELLHRAVSNLVLNAMDAMPNGGTLTLRTRRDDGKVIIEIADTGSGLTREECDRIFTPYYTSKQHGTGLGLAIVQSVVSDHGGRISVQSEPGRGTTFVIELPENTDALQKTGT